MFPDSATTSCSSNADAVDVECSNADAVGVGSTFERVVLGSNEHEVLGRLACSKLLELEHSMELVLEPVHSKVLVLEQVHSKVLELEQVHSKVLVLAHSMEPVLGNKLACSIARVLDGYEDAHTNLREVSSMLVQGSKQVLDSSHRG